MSSPSSKRSLSCRNRPATCCLVNLGFPAAALVAATVAFVSGADRRAGARDALGRRLGGRVEDQRLQFRGGNEMPPQEGLHPVFRRHGLVRDLPLADLRAACDGQVDRLVRSRPASVFIVSRATAWVPVRETGAAEKPGGGSFKLSLMGPVKPSLRMA